MPIYEKRKVVKRISFKGGFVAYTHRIVINLMQLSPVV